MGQKFTIEAPDVYLKSPGSKCNIYIDSNKPLPRTISLATIFHEIDTTKDGLIQPRELRNYLKKRGIKVSSNKLLMDMFRTADRNGDYDISFQEFSTLMKKVEKGILSTSSTSGNMSIFKWKQFFKEIRDEVRSSFEIRLYEIRSNMQAKMISSRPVGGNGEKSIVTSISNGFVSKKKYYISLYQINGDYELARTKTISCQDHASVIEERTIKEMRKHRSNEMEKLKEKHERELYEQKIRQRLNEEEQIRRTITIQNARSQARKMEDERHRETTLKLKDLFYKIDANNNNQISFLELQQFVLKHWSTNLTTPSSSSSSSSSSMSSSSSSSSSKKRIREESSIVTNDEVENEERLAIISNDIRQMFREADVDYSGYINYYEFEQIMIKASNNDNDNKRWNEMYNGFVNTYFGNIRPKRIRYRR